LADGRDGFVRTNRAHNVERRTHGAIFIGSPAHQSEQLTGRIAFDALAAADNPFRYWLAELEPVLAFAFAPEQRYVSQLRPVAQPRLGRPARWRVAIRPQARLG
jgi:hypothetical protein